MEKEYLNERDVSQVTGIALSTLRLYRKNKTELPFIRVGKKLIRYSHAAVTQYMKEKTVEVN